MKLNTKLLAAVAIVTVGLAFSGCQKLIDEATATTDSAEDFSNDQGAITAFSDLMSNIIESQSFLQKTGNSQLSDLAIVTYYDTVLTDGNGIHIGIEFPEDVANKTIPVCGNGWAYLGSFELKTNLKQPSEDGFQIELSKADFIAVKASSNGSTYAMKDGTESYLISVNSDLHAGFLKLIKVGSSGLTTEYSLGFIYSLVEVADSWGTYLSNVKAKGVEVYEGTFSDNQTEGNGTSDRTDDTYETTGTCNYVNHSDVKYAVTISEKLIRKGDPDCSKTFVKGTMEIQNDGSKSKLKMNFGDGTCDNKVEVELPGGIKKTITVN